MKTTKILTPAWCHLLNKYFILYTSYFAIFNLLLIIGFCNDRGIGISISIDRGRGIGIDIGIGIDRGKGIGIDIGIGIGICIGIGISIGIDTTSLRRMLLDDLFL